MINPQGSTEIQQKLVAGADGIRLGREGVQADRQAEPNDPNIQLELAQAAEQAGDTASAIAAYKEFLEAGSRRPERTDREAAAEAAETDLCRIGIDSRGR